MAKSLLLCVFFAHLFSHLLWLVIRFWNPNKNHNQSAIHYWLLISLPVFILHTPITYLLSQNRQAQQHAPWNYYFASGTVWQSEWVGHAVSRYLFHLFISGFLLYVFSIIISPVGSEFWKQLCAEHGKIGLPNITIENNIIWNVLFGCWNCIPMDMWYVRM